MCKNNFLILAVLLAVSYVNAKPIATQEYHDYHHQQEEEQKKPPIPILKQDFEQHHEGYQYSYETGNGIHVQEQGYIKNKGDKKHETLVQQGTITYHDEHGHPITLTYIADEHGFQPVGQHLPTPPPVPEHVAKVVSESKSAPQVQQHEYHQQEAEQQQQQHQGHYQQQQQHQHQQYEHY